MSDAVLREVDVERESYRMPALLADGARVVVTGCAGFIGSHLSEALLAAGCRVTGIDCVNDYYDPALKRENLAHFQDHPGFSFVEEELTATDAAALLDGAVAVFHLAAQAGVRASWGGFFDTYLQSNVQATQRLLEAARTPEIAATLKRFVYSSSSSVYGDGADLPVRETALPKPFSPYGVTKLAAEHLCGLYAANHDVPVTSLRYFTVYGPRQRPDMAFRKFIEAAFEDRPWPIFGDGSQTRDFTYVADAVQANLLAVLPDTPNEVVNVGGGSRIDLASVLEMLKSLLKELAPQLDPRLEHRDLEKGDVTDTWSDPSRCNELLGWQPRVPIEEGLRREVAWVVDRRRRLG